MQGHEENKYPPRKAGIARRVADGGRPSPSVVSGGEVPGNDAPFVRARSSPDRSISYAEVLSAALPARAPAPTGLRLASFFCGCGGVDLGFRSAGFELAFASDYNARAAETFARNLGHVPLVSDVREVRGSALPPRIDVLAGGFPCVSFSMAGRRLGVEDSLNGKLYLELCRLIGEVRPPYFVAENVRGILSANGGAAVKLVLAAFLRLGYRTEWRLVNMAEHGVPQTRERVIFVGVRLDRWRGSFRFPEKTHRLRGDRRADGRLLPAVSLRQAISDLGDPSRRLAAGTGGENAYVVRAASEGREISERKAQRLRGADEPSATPTIHPPHVVEEIRAVTHVGGATLAAIGRPPTQGYGYSRPRGPDDPSHSQATSPNVLHVRAFGALNAYDASAKRGRRPPQDGGGPAPTVLSEAAPMLVGARNDDFFNPLRSAEEPSPTLVSSEAPELRFAQHDPNDVPGYGFEQTRRVAESSKPAPASTTPPQNQPFIDGMRRMTVRECARVQTFPDWFEFAGSQADGYRQVGNAVPPLYARLLAEAILEYEQRR